MLLRRHSSDPDNTRWKYLCKIVEQRKRADAALDFVATQLPTAIPSSVNSRRGLKRWVAKMKKMIARAGISSNDAMTRLTPLATAWDLRFLEDPDHEIVECY